MLWFIVASGRSGAGALRCERDTPALAEERACAFVLIELVNRGPIDPHQLGRYTEV